MTDSFVDTVGLGRLRLELDDLRTAYASAAPFPHLVLDDFLPADVFAAAVAEFPPIGDSSWAGYVHVNETKFANPHAPTWGPTLRSIAEALCSDEFVELLGAVTGFGGLLADPTMDGGGLHQTRRGGHLNIHADFTTHHRQRNWQRRVNVLLYLHDEWRSEWGGNLELWDHEVQRCVRDVAPVGNRMLVFTTSHDAYHGHPEPLACPPDVARQSLALYYFTEEHRPARRATAYRARPGDGLKRVAIWADRQVLRVYDRAKTSFGLGDEVADGPLGRAYRTVARRRNQPS